MFDRGMLCGLMNITADDMDEMREKKKMMIVCVSGVSWMDLFEVERLLYQEREWVG